MAITNEQRTLRRGRLGSSDAPRIMAGDWQSLWAEKTGRAVRPPLDDVPAVQIGIATEPLHARFYQKRTGIPCLPAERTLVHPDHAFMVAHLDFVTWREPPRDPFAPPDTILEAKFHGGDRSDDDLVQRYYWQLQHQMLVGDYAHAILSVLRPSRYTTIGVPRDAANIAVLIEMLRSFWWHVENDIEPDDAMIAAVSAPDPDTRRIVDMRGHNAFTALGSVLVENRAAVGVFRDAELALKALLPDDAQIAYLASDEGAGADGPGVLISRSRDGRVSLRFGALPAKYRHRVERWLGEREA